MYNQIILIGILVSMLFTEITNLSAGLIIPGYLMLALRSPERILYTLVIAAIAVGLCRFCSRHLILYGKRRFAFLMVTTFLLAWLCRSTGLVSFSVVGTVLPGIIAREFDRQGFGLSLLAMSITTGLTALIAVILGYGSILG